MAPALMSYFGRGGAAAPPVEDPKCETKNGVRALPASWYISEQMYELERRAIFSRQWQLITHKARLTKPGDWLRYDVAGFQFVLSHDNNGNIHGFHNICRHRAFPVVSGDADSGNSKIFACKYHGWSYGLNGKLAKAPGYQELDGFDKSINGLLPIHVHVDLNGFIWVNLDGKSTPELSFEEQFEGADRRTQFEMYKFDDYVYDHTWEMTGDWNWKILADNYNECYHCPTSHPDIPSLADLKSYNVQTKACQIFHDAATTPEQAARGLSVCPTYYFPNASMNVSPHFFFMQRFVPHAPGKSTMRYEVYRNMNSSEEDFQLINQMYKRIMSEDKALCEAAQKNINAGIFVNGEMHPRMEKGPLYFQKLVRDTVTAHHQREQVAKQEIWPARQILPNNSGGKISQQDIEFCSGLACAPAAQEQLVW